MTISVLLFARYREVAGVDSIDVQVPENATLADVWNQVKAKVPAFGREGGPLFSCDRAYARADRTLVGGEEIAIFPPVSGG